MGKQTKRYTLKLNKILEAEFKYEKNIILDVPDKVDKLPSVSVLTITKIGLNNLI